MRDLLPGMIRICQSLSNLTSDQHPLKPNQENPIDKFNVYIPEPLMYCKYCIETANVTTCPQVKFTSSNNPPNGDAKIDLGTPVEFSGLTKEDLMKYADDPFWVRLRWGLFILFWLVYHFTFISSFGWFALLV